MEETSSPNMAAVPASKDKTPPHGSARVSVFGIFMRLAVAIAILGGAGWFAWSVISSKPEGIRRMPRERSFTVSVMDPVYQTYTSKFRAFGQVVATRSVEIRSRVLGEVIEISPKLDAGNLIEEGEVLLAIDSTDYDGSLVEARASLADARLSLSEAQQAYKLQQIKLEAAQESLASAQRDLERAQRLNENGTLTNKELEERELTVTEREQTISEIENALFTQQATIDRQTALIVSAQFDVDEAERAVDNTTIEAPFTGVVVDESVGLGSYITANETVASLYDPVALDISFTISDQQYGQLLTDGLIGREIQAVWDIEPEPIVVSGRINRTDPEIDSTTGGVTLFARLVGDNADQLRPGTFVEVEVPGPAYDNTLRVPETTVYENNHIYVLRDGRMAKIDATIKTRDDDYLIIAAAVPAGERIITTRLSQAGEGVSVTVEGEEDTSSPFGGAGGLPPGAVRQEDGSIKMPDGRVIPADAAARMSEGGGPPAGGPPPGGGGPGGPGM